MSLVVSSPVSTGWFEGKSYSTFEVSSESASAVENLKFTLKIEEAELINRGFIKEKVRLFQESGALATTLLRVENGYVYYQAESESFGTFVIGAAAEPKAAIAGKAVVLPPVEEEPAAEPAPAEEVVPEEAAVEELSFWQKIGNFFKNLFS